MTARQKKAQALSLRDAFDAERARREMERREREDAERRQHEQDLSGAEALFAAISADPAFLEDHELTADRRRYTVSLDHRTFRVSAYFEAGSVGVTLSDKRNAIPGAAAPRKQETVNGVEDALKVMAQFLADEIR